MKEKVKTEIISVINFVFCALILILGFIRYKEGSTIFALYVGIAFGMFGASHLLTIFGLEKKYPVITIGLRTLAYLYILYILFMGINEV